MLSVAAITRRIRTLLEGSFPRVAVEGEIGQVTRARSGHLYLTLKDETAVLDVVCWRSTASRLAVSPTEGMRVVARGEVTVYEPRGRYQLVATSLRPAGEGALRARFEALVARLRGEGLFDPEQKKPLPALPGTVGIVTSPTGAAVRDIIRILRRRFPPVRIVLSPTVVQGSGAAEAVAAAMARLDRWGGAAVMIVGRGGGSLEDLWAFNEEAVARAIFAARTPVVSAVGHEVDVTVADLVADLRAATPSEAAEAVVPDRSAIASGLAGLGRRLAHALRGRVREGRSRLRALARTAVLRRPETLLRTREQRLDEVSAALAGGWRETLRSKRTRLDLAATRLAGLSPTAVLARGYSITLDAETGALVRDAADAAAGMALETRLARGRLRSTVSEIFSGEEPHGQATDQEDA